MTEKWIAVSPIPQLFIETDAKIDDFIILKNIAHERLRDEYKIDFKEMGFNLFERDVWTSSPVYVREFEANENDFYELGNLTG